MSLPSGYRRLEYIQSSGTQCIDTGVTFEKSDALEYEVVMTVTPPSFGRYFGGGDYTQLGIGTSGYGQYAASNTKAYGGKDTVHVAWNPSTNTETCTVNGEQVFTLNWASVTITNVKVGFFRLGYSNNGWYDSNMTTAALYSGKVWKNGALVRDFIPAKNASGVVGLWDDVGGVFYENAGTGVFTAGAEVGGTHRTLIGGTAYEVKGGSVMVDGTVYQLKKGLTMIDGTVYEIPFESGTPISSFPVGSEVEIAVNGTLREFIIVNQGIPGNSSLYDDSCNGTWLLMKDIYEERKWNSSNENYYNKSTTHEYLNSSFLSMLDSNVQAKIKQIKIPYISNVWDNIATSGVDGLPTQIFLLGWREVGFDANSYSIDGERMSFFDSGTGTTANSKRIALLDGSATAWGLRTSYPSTGSSAVAVGIDGSQGYVKGSGVTGIRPAFVLPFETLVSDNIISG